MVARSKRTRFRLITRGAVKRLLVLAVVIIGGCVWAYFAMIRMPGRSFRGPLPEATPAQRALAEGLRIDVEMLAGTIGSRDAFNPHRLEAAATWIEASLVEIGYDVERQTFPVTIDGLGVVDEPCSNLIVEIPGSDLVEEIIVIGAHYDTCDNSPGANDNTSGVAGTLALARAFVGASTRRTLRFVFFVNEEPPFFQTDQMGSAVYAKSCRARDENIAAMISLETIGCYSDDPGSQAYPIPIGWLYPDAGNFIAFVSNVKSGRVLRRSIGAFREHAQFPSEGAALPGAIAGIGWSDHWAFWQQGYPGVMVTDTAPFRYEHYHRKTDLPDKLDYDRMASVVEGMEAVVRELVDGE